MSEEPLFTELPPGTGHELLKPGMYTAGCAGMFNPDSVRDHMGSHLSPGCCNGCFTGVLIPYFMHNINNLMVGVMGNLDLAGMFMPDIARVEPKISAARSSTGSVVDFIRDVSEVFSPGNLTSLTNEDLKKTLLLLKAACGRSVASQGIDGMAFHESPVCSRPVAVLCALRGMAAWCVLCLGGSGILEGEVSGSSITLRWSRPAGSGRPHMPGGDTAGDILALAGGVAASAGNVLVVNGWTDMAGEVTIAYK